jgi:hypothetical protein
VLPRITSTLGLVQLHVYPPQGRTHEAQHHFRRHPCKLIINALQYPSLFADPTLCSAVMASGRDVRDMLGLPAGGDVPKAAVQKRPKPAGGLRKIRTCYSQTKACIYWGLEDRLMASVEGVAREVAALYGERPPPVAVYEEKKSYRAKRQNTGPAKKWCILHITQVTARRLTVYIGNSSPS